MSKNWDRSMSLPLLFLVCLTISCGVAGGPRKAWMNGNSLLVSCYMNGLAEPCAVLLIDSENTYGSHEYTGTICSAFIVDPEDEELMNSGTTMFEEFGPDIVTIPGLYSGIIVAGAAHSAWNPQSSLSSIDSKWKQDTIAMNVVNVTISGLSDEVRAGIKNGKFDILVLFSRSLPIGSHQLRELVDLWDVPLSKREYYYVSRQMYLNLVIATIVFLFLFPFVLMWRKGKKSHSSAKNQSETEGTKR